MVDKFFVYGTLKVGGYYASLFNEFRVSSKPAKLFGYRMFEIGPYPGIVKGDGIVYGEVHEYSNKTQVLREMDLIEGYRGDGLDLFVRRETIVVYENGKTEAVFIYVFNRDIFIDMPEIKSGNWEIRKHKIYGR